MFAYINNKKVHSTYESERKTVPVVSTRGSDPEDYL